LKKISAMVIGACMFLLESCCSFSLLRLCNSDVWLT